MIIPNNYEELAEWVTKDSKVVFFFTADWCPDCRFIYPVLPEIEAAFSEFTFVRVDRDEFMDLAKEWDVFGIPSLVVTENGKELGRFVDKNRKTKKEITDFLEGLK